MIGRAAALLALLAVAAAAQEPVVPKLPDLPATPPAAPAAPATAPGDAAAQPLPAMMTICIDRAMQRCWTTMIPRECARAHGAEAYATLPADSRESGLKLRECWDTFRE